MRLRSRSERIRDQIAQQYRMYTGKQEKRPRPLLGCVAILAPWLIAAVFVLTCCTGCASNTREKHEAVTQIDRSFTISGSVAIPVEQADGTTAHMPIAVDLTVDGGGVDHTTGEAKSRTEHDGPKLIVDALMLALKTQFPMLAMHSAPRQPGKPEDDWTSETLVGASGIALVLAREAMAARRDKKDREERERQRQAEIKARAESDAAWDAEREAAIKAALLTPPPKGTA